MRYNNKMNKKTIDCIPSKTLREYLVSNHFEMSVLQQATIVLEYADENDYVSLLEILIEGTTNEDEILLLSSVVEDLKNCIGNEYIEYISEETQKIYDEKFRHDGFPLYPFLEVCGLPVLFKKGDIVRAKYDSYDNFYYVGALPLLIANHCDFSDECYLCYNLSYPVMNEDDLVLAHEHIHICVAERASRNDLTRKQRSIYKKIKALLSK